MNSLTSAMHPERVFRALSDTTRLRILNLLVGGELCVCDLVYVLDLPQPTISRHLAYLKKVGLVAARKEGLWQHYRLLEAESNFHQQILACVAACSPVLPELQDDVRRLKGYGRIECQDT